MSKKTAGSSRNIQSPEIENARSARERELVMKVTKEIVVKFVEMGKVTPSSFQEVFSMVHESVSSAMKKCKN